VSRNRFKAKPQTSEKLSKGNKDIGIVVPNLNEDRLKLAAGIIFLNDYSSLKRCLDSLIYGVHMIFAIDGRFPNFLADSDLSTDGNRELVKTYPQCMLIDFPRSEFEKRSKYLEYCQTYSVDVLLIIDSDEFVETKHKMHESLIIGSTIYIYRQTAYGLR
jgi:hypothetical protein